MAMVVISRLFEVMMMGGVLAGWAQEAREGCREGGGLRVCKGQRKPALRNPILKGKRTARVKR